MGCLGSKKVDMFMMKGRRGQVRTEEAELAITTSFLRRTLSVEGVGAQAKLLLGRLEVIGPGAVNNNVFSTRWAADQSRLSIGRRRGGSLSTTTFFPPGRRYPQSDCSLEGSGRVIGCLSRPIQKPQVGGWRVAGGVGSPHQQTSYDESKREGF